MDSKKKLLVVVLIVLTLVLGGASIFLSQQLQNTQAPSSSSADTIVGQPATNTTLVKINNIFQANGCSSILSNDTIAFYAQDGFSEINKLQVSYVESFPISTNCTAFLSNDEQIDVSINLYDPTQTSSLTSAESEANAQLSDTVIKSASVSFSPYFFGELKNDSTTCQTNIFSKLNDFKYITLTYRNFNKSCTELTDFSTQITYVVGMAANNLTRQAKDTTN